MLQTYKPGTLLRIKKDIRGAVTSLTKDGGVNGFMLNSDKPLVNLIVEVIRTNENGTMLVWIPDLQVFVDSLGKSFYG